MPAIERLDRSSAADIHDEIPFELALSWSNFLNTESDEMLLEFRTVSLAPILFPRIIRRFDRLEDTGVQGPDKPKEHHVQIPCQEEDLGGGNVRLMPGMLRGK